jgi:hypothetical protein
MDVHGKVVDAFEHCNSTHAQPEVTRREPHGVVLYVQRTQVCA